MCVCAPRVARMCGARWLTVPCTRRAHFSYPPLIPSSCSLLFTSLRLGALWTLMLLPWKSYRVALFLWSNLCFRFRFNQFKKTCFKLRFRFVVTANLSSVFKGWKISRWRVFHKNLFATKEGGEKKELVWLRDPCKICHFNVCNVLRMHRDFLGKFFPPRHSRRVSS